MIGKSTSPDRHFSHGLENPTGTGCVESPNVAKSATLRWGTRIWEQTLTSSRMEPWEELCVQGVKA
jgi:hypothetical protein